MALIFFNFALEYAIREMSINSENTLINKSSQLAAYADDINIRLMARLMATRRKFI